MSLPFALSFPFVRRAAGLLVLAAISFFTPALHAQGDAGLGEGATGWVIDQAEILNPEFEAALNRRLADHEAATSNQIVVETVGALQGVPIADYSIAEATRLRIGQRGRDNGVLFLIAVEDREMRIEVGYGLEDRLTDALSGRILRQEVVPRFREQDYPAGVGAGVDAILGAIDGSYRGSPLDRIAGVSDLLEWVRVRLDALPQQAPQDQAFLGIFFFLFGPILSLLAFAWVPGKKLPIVLGLGLFLLIAIGVVWRYPWTLGAFGIFGAIAALVALDRGLKKVFPGLARSSSGRSSGGSSGSSSSGWSSSSSSSSSRSFSGGGGSFGGGGSSARW